MRRRKALRVVVARIGALLAMGAAQAGVLGNTVEGRSRTTRSATCSRRRATLAAALARPGRVEVAKTRTPGPEERRRRRRK